MNGYSVLFVNDVLQNGASVR